MAYLIINDVEEENFPYTFLDSSAGLIMKLTFGRITGEEFNYIHIGPHKNMRLTDSHATEAYMPS